MFWPHFLVGAPGIEPGLNGPKPLVLPLYYAPLAHELRPS